MIKSYMSRFGLTQSQLAERTGISQPTISHILHGAQISPKHAMALRQALSIPLYVMRPDIWPPPKRKAKAE